VETSPVTVGSPGVHTEPSGVGVAWRRAESNVPDPIWLQLALGDIPTTASTQFPSA
jgi:hypothetical protein